ncbi:MAG TPA: Hsp20/alpha crystallin family protein [Candidatus Paceibacterota bacterium]
MAQKKSFLARLTGMMEQEEDLEEEIAGASEEPTDKETSELQIRDDEELSDDGESGEGELAVDVFQKPTEIVVKAMVAGVKPEDLDVALTREMVTIKGKRERERHGASDEYSHKELYWGTFARSLVLPEEVDVDTAEANVQNGLLIIRLPKIDKRRTQKLKILKA